MARAVREWTTSVESMAGYIQALEEENGTGSSAHTNP
eukprot:COSAG01_NODE_42787_length_436_cov_1.774481_1_plen_36_part_10